MLPWKQIDRHPDTKAKNRAYEAFRALDTLTPEDLNLDTQEADIPALRFSPEAQQLFDDWHGRLEVRLRTGQGHAAAFESHLAKYRSLMPSLALLFHLVDIADGAVGNPVSAGATELAIRWCEYLEQHAQKLYAPEVRENVTAAHALAAKIQDGSVKDGQSVRDIYKRGWKGLGQNEVDLALEVLSKSNWVKVESSANPKGGRPSNVIRLHPDLRRE